MSLTPGSRLGHYEILAKLGEGGMGVVYKARDIDLDRFVAIKVLPPEAVADPERKRRFTQEAKAASALNHPGIITIYEIARADGTDFMAMEYVQGKTLGELIGRKSLNVKDTLTYAIQGAYALAKAHETGIVHRDLKPSNIMVTDDGLVKILDFGVAKLTTSSDEDADQRAAMRTMTANDGVQTAAGTIVGTLAYMSPEQAEGKHVDARSDIFSFGAVLYEMATGTRAFQGTSSVQTLAAVVNAEPPPPSQVVKDLPRDLERIILRCLRKDPARRVQVMADLAVELEEIKTESGTHIAAAQAPLRKHRTRWAVASGVAAVVAVAGAWLWWATPTAPLASPSVGPLTALPGDELFPTFAPDGNQVAFAWTGDKGGNFDIYVMPIGAATPLRLTTDPAEDSAPAWSPDGSQIAFVRRQGNAAAIYLTTPPLPNAERKLTDFHPPDILDGPATVSWFPDGKHLVFAETAADGETNGIVMIPVDKGERRRLLWTPVSTGSYYFPTVSPTGGMLGYALLRNRFSSDVHVTELAEDFTSRGGTRRLTEGNSIISGIAWTPDGRSLIYGAGGSPASLGFLWRVPLAGGTPERVELAGDQACFPAVSRAGNQLAYSRFGHSDIWKFEAGKPREDFLSTSLDDLSPQFSPDGKKIAFESGRLGKQQLFVADADGTNQKPLEPGGKGARGSARWSPDSRSIVFDGQEEDGSRAIYMVDADGGQPHLLTSPASTPSWSHNGTWIYFTRPAVSGRSVPGGLSRMPAAGGSPVQITSNGASGPLESPDGTTLYYRKGSVPGVLFAMPVAGGPERRVLDSIVAVPFTSSWFPVDDGIYYAARPAPDRPFAFELRFLNFATGRHEMLYQFEARSGIGLTVSPDKKTILYSGTKPSDGPDLRLIRNFR